MLNNMAVPNLLFARGDHRTNDLFAHPLPQARPPPRAAQEDVDAMDIDNDGMDIIAAEEVPKAPAATDVRQLMETVKARHVAASAPPTPPAVATAPTFDFERAMQRLKVPKASRGAFCRDVKACDAVQLVFGKRYMRELLLHGRVHKDNDDGDSDEETDMEEEVLAIIPLCESEVLDPMLHAYIK